MACPACGIQLVTKEKTEHSTIGSIVGALPFAVGALMLVGGFAEGLMLAVAGGVLMIVGMLIAFGSGDKYTVMVCPRCKQEISRL
jgi:predicted RNA-binding Zn-ribbon protein involved in translation (DUF1610 family)